MPKYTQQQFWKLYPKLPQELKDALGSEETGETLYEICERNGILDRLGEVVELTGQVLLGLLLPQNFQKALEKELQIKRDVSQRTAQEINRFIFYPVRPILEQLHETTAQKQKEVKTSTPVPVQVEGEQEKKIKQKGPDKYRESVE